MTFVVIFAISALIFLVGALLIERDERNIGFRIMDVGFAGMVVSYIVAGFYDTIF